MSDSKDSPNCVRAIDRNFDSPPRKFNMGDDMHTPAEEMMDAEFRVDQARSLVLDLGAQTGTLCGLIKKECTKDDLSTNTLLPSSQLGEAFAALLLGLVQTSTCLSIHLETAIRKKMLLNALKYPVNHCKGKAGKYTEYSHITGITKDRGQSTVGTNCEVRKTAYDPSVQVNSDFVHMLPTLTKDIRTFAVERDWTQYHLPRSLTLALLGELGELAELLQYRQDNPQQLTVKVFDKLCQEIADVTIYLIRLVDVHGVCFKEQVEKLNVGNA